MGLLELTHNLLEGAHQKDLQVFEGTQASQVTDLVLNKLLFGDDCQLKEESLAHMTRPEDLKVFERAASYKCHHRKSREAAYKLFLFLMNQYLSPEEFDHVVSRYWTNLIMRMEKPAQTYYDPSKRNRASNGFAGLKNLGSTCYMNSML